MLAGRYRLRAPIGAGDLGMVWSATDEILGRTVAVKYLIGEQARIRLLREARMAAHVTHPRLLRVFDVLDNGPDQGAWMVLQYVHARPWAAMWLERGRIPPRAAAHVAAQVADALSAMHRAGLVHRDVTPDNILVDADGEVKLVDFGSSLLLDEGTDEGSLMTGGRDYRAPEVRAGAAPGTAADVYALGAAVGEAVYGPSMVVDQLPDAPLTHVLVRMLATDPGWRPSAATAVDLLAAVATGR